MRRIIDGHCDVISKLMMEPSLDFTNGGDGLDVTLTRLVQAGVLMQCFAIYLPQSIVEPQMGDLLKGADIFHNRIVADAGLKAIRTSNDLVEAARRQQPCAMLTVEGADALNGNMDHLQTLFQLGVRALGLTWNYANWAVDGIGEPRNGGFTLKGRTLVKQCNNLGILIDVSHLSVQGFWELTELSDRPFIASHSNVLELCGHRRNLNEQQIRTIGERGGVIGINLFPPFLSSGNDASIEHIVAHIEKVCEWGGVHAAALGSDFDGIDQKVPGLENPAQLPNLLDALSKIFSDEQIERITYRNWYDFFVRELPKTECYT